MGMIDDVKGMAGNAMDKLKVMTNDIKDELSGLSGDEFDKRYLNMMISHHEQGIEMAKMAQEKASSEEVKKMSADMLQKNQQEINQMKQMQQDIS